MKAAGNFWPKIGGGAVLGFSFGLLARVGGAIGLVLLAGVVGSTQPPMGDGGNPYGQGPVYQWHASDWNQSDDGHYSNDGHKFNDDWRENRRGNYDGRREIRRDYSFASPRISSGWFERPYPYHLDFFRMRFGSRVGPLEPPYGPTLPAYYGPYYTSNGIREVPYGEPAEGGPLVEVPEKVNWPTAAGAIQDSSKNESLPAPTRVDSGKTPK